MGEGKPLTLTIIALILLSAFFLLFPVSLIRAFLSPLYVDYTAIIDIDRRITLKEVFLFSVREGDTYQMLFRNWKVPLLFKEASKEPHIRAVDFGGDGAVYLKDSSGRIFGEGLSPDERELVKKKALNNELGMVRAGKFPEGRFGLFGEYMIYPPYESDNLNSHLNIKLGDEHAYYRSVKIVIRDTAGIIVEVFPHLPAYDMSRSATGWVIEGIAPENSLLEVEILTKPFEFEGVMKYVSNVKGRTEVANAGLTLFHRARDFLKGSINAVFFLYPLFLVLIYWFFGSERGYSAPQYLSYIPNQKRKPWLVNLIFASDASRSDENALFATLLDLERRGKIKVDKAEGDIRIRVLDESGLDAYERRVVGFLKRHSREGAFSPEEVEALVDAYLEERDASSLERLKKEVEGVTRFSDPSIVKGFLSTAGYRIVKFTGIALSVLLILAVGVLWIGSSIVEGYVDDLLFAGVGALLVLNIPHLFLRPQVFGRWKRDFYRERLEWEAFRNFLSDLAMIKKYAPEDVSIWEDWLIYGTALGVADKVEEAMAELKVEVPVLQKAPYTRHRMHIFHRHVHGASVSSSKGGGLGGLGGFGAGGGFGGGGAGGR